MSEKLTDEALEEIAEELNNDMPLFPHEKRMAASAIRELLAHRRATPADDLRARPALQQIRFLAAEARPAGYVMALERIEKIALAALAQKGDA